MSAPKALPNWILLLRFSLLLCSFILLVGCSKVRPLRSTEMAYPPPPQETPAVAKPQGPHPPAPAPAQKPPTVAQGQAAAGETHRAIVEGLKEAGEVSPPPPEKGTQKKNGGPASSPKKPQGDFLNGRTTKKSGVSKPKIPPSRPAQPAAGDGGGESPLLKIVRQIAYLWPDSMVAGEPYDVLLEIRPPGGKPPADKDVRGEAELGFESTIPEPRLRVTLTAPGFDLKTKAEQEVRITWAGTPPFLKWVVIPQEGPAHQLNFSFSAEYGPDDFRPVRVDPYKFAVKVRGTFGLPPWVYDWPAKGAAAVTGFFAFIGGVVSGLENLQKLKRKLAKIKFFRKRGRGTSS